MSPHPASTSSACDRSQDPFARLVVVAAVLLAVLRALSPQPASGDLTQATPLRAELNRKMEQVVARGRSGRP